VTVGKGEKRCDGRSQATTAMIKIPEEKKDYKVKGRTPKSSGWGTNDLERHTLKELQSLATHFMFEFEAGSSKRRIIYRFIRKSEQLCG